MLYAAPVAVLRSSEGVERPIEPRLLVGRSKGCALRLQGTYVSSTHATIAWTGHRWEIRDLGSRNGTFVDGVRLKGGLSVPLHSGTRVAFGDPEAPWEVVDDAPPAVMATHVVSGEIRAGEADLLVLPSAEGPEVCVYDDGTSWRFERGDGQGEVIADGAVVGTSQGAWRIQLPVIMDGTPLLKSSLSLALAEFRFEVSQNEERVDITIVGNGTVVRVPPREHAYVLLTLARARLQDAHLGPGLRGWRDRDQLERMLVLDSRALNMAIYRARQQLSGLGLANAAGVVEVRHRQRRLGTDRVSIGPQRTQ